MVQGEALMTQNSQYVSGEGNLRRLVQSLTLQMHKWRFTERKQFAQDPSADE